MEKSPFVGGTTALSGGMVWMPANRRMMEAGLTDTAVDAKAYLDAVIGHTSEMQEVFLENASRCVDYLQRNTAVQLRPVVNYPDYYPNLAGATLGGRVLEPEPFDGRKLHKDLEIVRPPLPEFTLFGGMMVDRAHIPHFRKVFRSIRSTLCVGRLLLRYAGERLSHRRGTSLVLGNALVARLLYSARAADVDFMLSTTVTELHFENGAVAGASIAVGGKVSRLYASRGVVLRHRRLWT
ncbi:MAG: FAD-binding protein [Pseudolabrys sp.]